MNAGAGRLCTPRITEGNIESSMWVSNTNRCQTCRISHSTSNRSECCFARLDRLRETAGNLLQIFEYTSGRILLDALIELLPALVSAQAYRIVEQEAFRSPVRSAKTSLTVSVAKSVTKRSKPRRARLPSMMLSFPAPRDRHLVGEKRRLLFPVGKSSGSHCRTI